VIYQILLHIFAVIGVIAVVVLAVVFFFGVCLAKAEIDYEKECGMGHCQHEPEVVGGYQVCKHCGADLSMGDGVTATRENGDKQCTNCKRDGR
jgi:hypothetical protein